jgi:predicted amino acid dehydrogenase
MPDMVEILSVSIGSSRRDHEFHTSLLGHDYHVRRIGTDGNKLEAIRIIRESDGKVAAMGLGGADVYFIIGGRTYIHQDTYRLVQAARETPVVDGATLKQALERWAIKWVLEKRPGLFDNKKILVMSGLDRGGVAEVLSEYTDRFIFGDFMYALKIPVIVKSLKTIQSTARWLMPILTNIPFEAIYPTGHRQDTVRPIFQKPIEWADVIVGDFHFIRRYAPSDLVGKIVVTNTLIESDIADLRSRGVSTLITTTPEMDGRSFGANVLEAIFQAHLRNIGEDLSSLTVPQLHDKYLNLILKSGIEPRVIDLNPEEKKNLPKFAFVIHPTSYDQLFLGESFKKFKSLPRKPVEELAAKHPPFFVSKITGIKTPDGNEAEGYFYAIGATPKMIKKLPPEIFYKSIAKIGQMAQDKGVSVMGLGAFTSVIGDAGVTINKLSPIPVTTGNSYTIWALFESIREGAEKMGIELSGVKVMVIGATGSIGKAVTLMLAELVPELVLIAPRPERLMELARSLEKSAEKHGRKLVIQIGTGVSEFLSGVDIVVAASSAGKGVLDVMKLKKGALVCDVAMPPDVSREEAGKRDDILVIASGEIAVPGQMNLGIPLGLPDGVAWACLSETVLLALDKRYEPYTLGREIDIDRVKEIGEIGKKHGFKLAPIMAFGEEIPDEMIAEIRKRAGR